MMMYDEYSGMTKLADPHPDRQLLTAEVLSMVTALCDLNPFLSFEHPRCSVYKLQQTCGTTKGMTSDFHIFWYA